MSIKIEELENNNIVIILYLVMARSHNFYRPICKRFRHTKNAGEQPLSHLSVSPFLKQVCSVVLNTWCVTCCSISDIRNVNRRGHIAAILATAPRQYSYY